ncbi:MAG: hypothetical protein QM680_12305 [Luteolibacter sp.]
MNVSRILAALGVLTPLLAFGQNVPDGNPQADPVLEAIRGFNQREEGGKPNEVHVTLDPPAAEEKTVPIPVAENPQPEPPTAAAPPEPESPEKPAPPITGPAPVTEDARLTVDVEKLQAGKGVMQTGSVKLLAPFPPKPLTSVPAGWQLEAQADVPLIQKDVELGPDQKITLTIRPHLLVPTVDGSTSFTIREPGYNPNLGYQQTATIGAILSNSIQQLDEEAKLLGNAVDQLQQLLVSLPNPEIAAPATAAPQTPAPPAPRRTR